MCASHRAVRGLIAEMTAHGDFTVTDMEAGLEHLKRGTARNVDCMLIVAEPYYRSLEAAARTYSLARELAIPYLYVVANKPRSKADQTAIESFCRQHDMPIIATVPFDESFAEAERAAQAPIDFAPDSPGIRAIVAIADQLCALGAPVRDAPKAAGLQQPTRPAF
jgi:CO dehydrogenase maturation factor